MEQITKIFGDNIPPGTYTITSPDMNDIFKKQSMEKQLEELLAKPEWQEHFMAMLVDWIEQPEVYINEMPKYNFKSNEYNNLLVLDVQKFNEVTQFFTPDKFYDILKKHIKTIPKETDKPIFNPKMDLYKEGKYSEHDVIWNTKEEGASKASTISTRHLFYIVRMCYNRLVNKSLRIDDTEIKLLKPYTGADGRHVLKCMFYQIGLRDDLTEEQLDKLTLMAKNVRLYL